MYKNTRPSRTLVWFICGTAVLRDEPIIFCGNQCYATHAVNRSSNEPYTMFSV